MNVPQGFNLEFVCSVARHSILPALSLMLVGVGGWFLGMRSLVSNIVTEDYVVYAELAGVDRRRILSSYVMRNALVPQVTGLAMSLGGIFNGAIITEKVFGYPGVGSLLVDAVYAGDYGLVLGVTTVSIIGVSIGGAGHRPALSAARSPRAGATERMLTILRDLLRYNRRVPHRRCCSPASSSCWRCCRSSRPIRRSTSMSCRPTCRRRGPICSAPRRAGRTCSGS